MLEFGSLVVMSEPFEGKVWGRRAATDARPSSLTQAWPASASPPSSGSQRWQGRVWGIQVNTCTKHDTG